MPRLHLFEFEDQPWFPEFLRNYGTDFLQFLSNKTKMYKPVIPKITEVLQKTKTSRVVDLGSGGGGGLLWLSQELKPQVSDLKITLTDYFPNLAAFEYTSKQSDIIDYEEKAVDARNVPDNLKGLRTMFLSFHHFKPVDAKAILQDAVDSGQPIGIFEGQERSAPSFLAMFFSPVTVLLTTPLIRPFKVGRILFTYLIPIIPLFVWWDGMVSSLRTYSEKEMKNLVTQIHNHEQFEWDIGKVKSGPGAILHLIGVPK